MAFSRDSFSAFSFLARSSSAIAASRDRAMRSSFSLRALSSSASFSACALKRFSSACFFLSAALAAASIFACFMASSSFCLSSSSCRSFSCSTLSLSRCLASLSASVSSSTGCGCGCASSSSSSSTSRSCSPSCSSGFFGRAFGIVWRASFSFLFLGSLRSSCASAVALCCFPSSSSFIRFSRFLSLFRILRSASSERSRFLLSFPSPSCFSRRSRDRVRLLSFFRLRLRL
mmetsp:Transcript_51315/g.109095  ORF Transcript_51315/g.109095 Transcript_51315/m.109095 type:complete len:231 (-) Transcript_51315:1433-2125(-)